jgi:hypothetical protein
MEKGGMVSGVQHGTPRNGMERDGQDGMGCNEP